MLERLIRKSYSARHKKAVTGMLAELSRMDALDDRIQNLEHQRTRASRAKGRDEKKLTKIQKRLDEAHEELDASKLKFDELSKLDRGQLHAEYAARKIGFQLFDITDWVRGG